MTVYAPRGRPHTCAAAGCAVHVARGMLMCRRHWYMLTRTMREAVWATYLDGAGVLSEGYRVAVDDAVGYLAEKEGIEIERPPSPIEEPPNQT